MMRHVFTVVITEKDGDERRVTFTEAEVTVGRVPGNDVVLPKGNVSKRHSRIVLKDNRFIVVDLKSTNGTYVNGRKITSPLVVKEGDKIYVGDYVLTLENAPALDALRPPSILGSPNGAPEDSSHEDSEPPDGSLPVVLRGGVTTSSMPPTSADPNGAPRVTGGAVSGSAGMDDEDESGPLMAGDGDLEEFEERPSREQERSSERHAPLHAFPPPIAARRGERRLFRHARGPDSATRDTLLGPLELLLSDPAVSHIVIDRFDRIRADRGNGLTLESLSFVTPEGLIDLANELALQAGVGPDAASFDVSLASGLHVVAVLPAAASNGPILSIRRRPTRFDTFTELHQRGLVSRSVVLKIEDALRHRRHVWLVGPSGVDLAGFMAGTLAACHADERVAVFERAPEVAVGDRAAICLKVGAVPIEELLERVRSFRPDRLAMHGLREDELPVVLETFAHRPEGNIASYEARSAKDALAAFDRAAGGDIALRAVSVIVELKRTDDMKTRVGAAYDIELDASGELALKQI